MRKFYLLVPCTKTKTARTSAHLRASTLPRKLSAVDRARAWVKRLQQASGSRQPARSLYTGAAWQVAQRLSHRVEEQGGEVFVVSAGFGLVRLDAPLVSYDATFTLGQKSSVIPGKPRIDERPLWWQTVADWAGPEANRPRTVTSLVRSAPDASFLVVLSEPYLRALQPDLEAARSAVAGGSLAVLGPHLNSLVDLLLPFSVRLQGRVGGPRSTLGLCLAAQLLDSLDPSDWSVSGFRQTLGRWVEALPASRSAPRTRLNDTAVRDFIREELDKTPGASTGSLLGRLRRSGRACGQERFERLFSELPR
jgi:hypothetical protein